MTSRRIIAVSPDEALRERIASGLRALGDDVETHASLDSVGGAGVALCVLHGPGDVSRLTGDCRVLVVLPRADLAASVAMMQASERVAGMIVAEDLDPHELAATAARLLSRNLFGVAKVMQPGTQIYEQAVRSPEERIACLQKVTDAAELADVPPQTQASIEQCIDEMLTNALYAAPVDEHGKQVFADVSAKDRATMAIDEPVFVQYACDDRQFAMSVRDAFGTLDRKTLLRVLHKCLHAQQKIDRKVSGAGVGLYLMVSSAKSVFFHVIPGVATEAMCAFAIDRAPGLQQLGFFVERADVTGTLAPARRYRPGSIVGGARRRRVLPITLAAVLALAIVGVVGYARFGRGKHAAAAPPVASLEVDSEPQGALVTIGGKKYGGTPVVITSLPPGSEASIVLSLRGYQPATQKATVPKVNERTRVVQKLAPSPDFVRVHFSSTPPGARVVALPEISGPVASSDHTYTPADLFVEAGKEHRFMLTMPHHAPVTLEPFTPARGAAPLEKTANLVEEAH